MRRLQIVFLVLVSFFVAGASSGQEPVRLALVIGNKSYTQKVGPLKNPHYDVALVGAALAKLGFKVTTLKDADYRTMDSAIKRHVAEIRGAGKGALSFFYYSGHGVANPDTQVNYLIPVDVAEANDANIWYQSFEQSTIIDRLSQQAPNATHYVVFDACRNELNLTGAAAKALGVEKGFVPVNHASGLLIAYATAPKQTASDMGDRGGAYATILAAEMVKPNVEAVTMFRNVQIRVKQAIGQDPWLSFPSVPPVYLAGELPRLVAPNVSSVSSASPELVREAVDAWGAIKDTSNIALLEAYIARYKDTFYAELARARIADLKKEVAIAAPPSAAKSVPPKEAAAAKKKSDEEAQAKIRADAEAKRQQEERVAAEKKATGERARQVEKKKRLEDAQITAERRAAEEKALRAAQAERDVQDADRYFYGRGVPQDYGKARQGYEKAAAVGHGGAMDRLGWMHQNGFGVGKDYSKAREWYEKGAAAGNPSAMTNLGRAYREGLGVLRDYAKAREWFERAVAAGNSLGMHNLGWLYENGWGVPRDYGKAREWYEKGAAAGSGDSMAQLGWFYRQGLGGSQDFGKAQDWSKKAVAVGNGGGMNNLGVFFEHGNGVAQDYLKAREWYEKAAAAGHSYGMRNLARLLDQGKGGSADFSRAAKQLLESARRRNDATIGDLRGSMTNWNSKTREELKRELFSRGHYKGPVHDNWDNDARTAVEKLLAS